MRECTDYTHTERSRNRTHNRFGVQGQAKLLKCAKHGRRQRFPKPLSPRPKIKVEKVKMLFIKLQRQSERASERAQEEAHNNNVKQQHNNTMKVMKGAQRGQGHSPAPVVVLVTGNAFIGPSGGVVRRGESPSSSSLLSSLAEEWQNEIMPR